MEILDNLAISYILLEHGAIKTMAEGQQIAQKLQGNIPVNLLFKDKQGTYYLIIKNKNIKINDIAKKFNIKGFKKVDEKEMTDLLGIEGGSLSVLALEGHNEIKVLIDENLEGDKVNLHPKVNTKTVTIEFDDMIKVINNFGNNIMFF